ncbi:proton-coupled amino acid transporter 1-like isoform X1 [Argiope bruennichi]|uniref:proton-coupled amino acid transporter 1-like isoform X1 n=2 Tax=Argiope bruennichi TaxID=94029 RepID=UPI0024946B72|nr:proton-coupled amino acid transporter 1-like isoform X1 [Argiope bruennichi]
MATERNLPFQPCINATNSSDVEHVGNSTDRTPLVRSKEILGSTNYGTLPNLETEDADEESENRPKEKKKTSNIGTFLHLIKGNVGTGILAMPIAISNFGLMAGILGIILLGVFCIYCMQLLVFCSKVAVAEKARRKQLRELQTQPGSSGVEENVVATDRVVSIWPRESNSEIPQGYQTYDQSVNTQGSANQVSEENSSLDYANTAFEAFRHGPQYFRSWASYMRFAVNLLLVLTQFGFCCVYFLFVGQSLHEVSLNMKVFTSLNTTTIMAIELPFMILLNFIPNLDMLTSVSTTAVGLQSVGLFMMFMYFVTGPFSDSIIPYIAPVRKWPLFFGTAMFSFEGIGVVLPLENEMKKKKSFRKIVNIGMAIVVLLYLLIGICGYIKYGADVKPSITFNLPVGCFSEVIRLLFALAIFLSYPLQMYVPFTFILPYLKRKLVSDGCNRCGELTIDWIIRTFLVCITFGIAVGVPMLDLVISFVGSVASSCLALILPTLIHIVTILKYDDIRYKKALIAVDMFLCGLGLFGLVVGAFTSISEMVNRNTTEVALTVASYDELMSSGINETILLLSSKNSSCCTLFH